MTDAGPPVLSLGEAPKNLRAQGGGGPSTWLALCLLALQAATLAALFLPRQGGAPALPAAPPGAGAGRSGEDLRAVALKLEERSLPAEAARAWEQAVAAEASPPADRAQVLYRIGKLHADAGDFERAAGALVRAELAAPADADLKAKIGQRLVECLRRLGRYGEVGRELSRRVEVGGDKTGKGKIVATYAGEELTEADVDRALERRVDQMLALQAGLAPAGPERAAQRQALLERFAEPETRNRFLQDLLQTELLCRRARELKLDQDDEFREASRSLEEKLLADRLVAKELEKLQPTDVDLEAHYKSNASDFALPETARVLWLPLVSGEEAGAVLERLKTADDFRAEAGRRAGTAEGAATGAATQPVPEEITRGRPSTKLHASADALFALAAGEWTKAAVGPANARCLGLVEEKTPARTPPFAEVRERVFRHYAERKGRELMGALVQDLMGRYDVRIQAPEKAPAGGSGK
ncbi:MAG: peptidyl-prolyl cis-trans isomerase [Planctomycetes bacterium]|nr:peptidyl-prolyl cis-trans isomerase [Planctomycetota bacterium]